MTMLEPQSGNIPIRRPALVSQPFWAGCADHKLLYQRCNRCGAAIFNPAPVCRTCTSADLSWHESAGVGTVYSWTIAWRPQSPAFTTPYAPIIVDLDEGYQMLSNLVGCDTEDVRVGMRVQVTFHAFDKGTLPYFRPVADEGSAEST